MLEVPPVEKRERLAQMQMGSGNHRGNIGERWHSKAEKGELSKFQQLPRRDLEETHSVRESMLKRCPGGFTGI